MQLQMRCRIEGRAELRNPQLATPPCLATEQEKWQFGQRHEWAPKPTSLVPLHAHGKILMAGVGNRAYVLCASACTSRLMYYARSEGPAYVGMVRSSLVLAPVVIPPDLGGTKRLVGHPTQDRYRS
jgi:hypothetical protein